MVICKDTDVCVRDIQFAYDTRPGGNDGRGGARFQEAAENA